MEIQNNDRIKQMVVRYVKGELSEEEMDELKRWRDERAEHEELFRNVVSREKLERGIRRFVSSFLLSSFTRTALHSFPFLSLINSLTVVVYTRGSAPKTAIASCWP